MSRYRNLIIMLGLDTGLVVVCFYAAYMFRFEFEIPEEFWGAFKNTWWWVAALKIVVFRFSGLYRGMWRYTSLVDLVNVLKAVVLSSLLIVALGLMVHRFYGHPRSVVIIDALMTFLAVGGIRVVIRLFYARSVGTSFFPLLGRLGGGPLRRMLIIGAGHTGEKVLREVYENPDSKVQVIGFLDTNPGKKGRAIHGVPVLGDLALLERPPVAFDEILIALPSVRGEVMRRIVDACEATGKPFRTVPAMGELIDGRVTLKAVRNVRVEDLLGRDELHLAEEEIARYLEKKRVLVTGAGGSIGSELVRQIGRFRPEAVGLLEINEFNLFRVETECRHRFADVPVSPYLADIRDEPAVARVHRDFNPEVVFHAAAYKHVPMQERFPWEAVLNNILGTRHLVDAAIQAGVERFVLVSTDKAVRPTNVMGATKRVAEMFVECINGSQTTRFMAVRFRQRDGQFGFGGAHISGADRPGRAGDGDAPGCDPLFYEPGGGGPVDSAGRGHRPGWRHIHSGDGGAHSHPGPGSGNDSPAWV